MTRDPSAKLKYSCSRKHVVEQINKPINKHKQINKQINTYPLTFLLFCIQTQISENE